MQIIYLGAHPPDTVKVIYTYTCIVCGKIHNEEWLGVHLVVPSHPTGGWRQLQSDRWICPKHKTLLMVDGEPFKDF